jgi:ppGpp synthetase/RelA/SpoT-type nucleotidyltranferase
MKKNELINEYDLVLKEVDQALRSLDSLFRPLHLEPGIKIHSISHRVKSKESFQYKVSRPDKTYESLWEVTDLVGFRVITYFESAIEEVARWVESRFEIDFALSTDKRQHRDTRQFGYRSLHYVCSFPAESGFPKEARF